jgi:hypothetical protein
LNSVDFRCSAGAGDDQTFQESLARAASVISSRGARLPESPQGTTVTLEASAKVAAAMAFGGRSWRTGPPALSIDFARAPTRAACRSGRPLQAQEDPLDNANATVGGDVDKPCPSGMILATSSIAVAFDDETVARRFGLVASRLLWLTVLRAI